MCGIIGYSGRNRGVEKILRGLSVLEYRGYDSVGLGAMCEGEIKIVKTRGRVGELSKILEESPIKNTSCAIGHTRWATHGAPTDVNAHPHRVGRVTLVHNGIIENYKELKAELSGRGACFVSDTDTEVAAAVIDEEYGRSGNPAEAIRAAVARFVGSYALAIIFDGHGGEIYAVRQASPLVLGFGEDGCYLASDITALLPFTRRYFPLAEGEVALVREDMAAVANDGDFSEIKDWKTTDLTTERAERGGYEHFMQKEMHEEPTAIRAALSGRVRGGLPDLTGDGISENLFSSARAVQIVACGSAMHAGLVGASLIERFAKLPTSVYIASEYRYYPPVISDGTLVIVISQSGETADTIAALRYARAQGNKVLGIVNATGTTIANESDFCVYTHAGPEIAVATTKGYSTQVAVLYLLAIAMGRARGKLTEIEARSHTENLLADAPGAASSMLERIGEISEIARKIQGRSDIFYIGRGLDYSVSMEASLKLKEISYIHSEAYAAGELKHGTISLIEDGTPTVAISTDDSTFDKLVSNLVEVRARGAFTVLISSSSRGAESADTLLKLPCGSLPMRLFSSILAVQLLAYEVARLRGSDIDRPRNLAKSVTVE